MIVVTMETIFDSYSNGLITHEEALELLQDNCDMDTEDAEAIIAGWDS